MRFPDLDDVRSAENTLSALRVSRHIEYTGIYTADGKFFAGWRDGRMQPAQLPPFQPGSAEVSFKNTNLI